MKKHLKFTKISSELPLFLIKKAHFFLLLIHFSFPQFASAALSQTQNSNSQLLNQANQSYNFNPIGFGFETGLKINLSSKIFSQNNFLGKNHENSKNKPNLLKNNYHNIFLEIGLFANQFASQTVKKNFGSQLNLGYEYNLFKIYLSSGFVNSAINYQNKLSNQLITINKSAPFFGGGFGYNLTSNSSIRLNSIFYQINHMHNSQNYKFNVLSTSLNLAFYL